MVITCFLSYGPTGAINDIVAFVMLRWLFRGNMPFCASVSTGAGISVMCHWHCIIWCWCYWHKMTKNNVASHFEHLDLRNAMMPLMTLSASHDANVNLNGITWPKRSCHTTLWLYFIDNAISIMWCKGWYHWCCVTKVMFDFILVIWPKECTSAINDTVGIMQCQSCYQRYHMTRKCHVAHHFDNLDLIKALMPLTVALAWWWYQCHWCHMSKKIMLHIILIILTHGMLWNYWQHHWHHMMPTPAQMASPDQKSNVALHFDCLDWRNALVLLKMPLESHDTNASTTLYWHWHQWYHMTRNVMCTYETLSVYMPHMNLLQSTMWLGTLVYIHVTLLKHASEKICLPHHTYICHWTTTMVSIQTSFVLSWPEECNGVIDDAVSITWSSANGIAWPKSHVAPCFDHLDLMNKLLHHVMSTWMPLVSHEQKVKLHLIFIIFT